MEFLKRYKIKWITKKLRALQHNRSQNQPTEQDLAKEIALYNRMIKIQKELIGSKSYPYAPIVIRECLRKAAALEDKESQYRLGKDLLDEGRFRRQLQEGSVFASPGNEKPIQPLFDEAHAYLQAAQKLGHIEAKRLLGLAYIHGWGVVPNKNQGFEMIVASIEQENAWERVPQIFAQLGLNKPEFFAELGRRKPTISSPQP